jgi:ABC-2 type transport system ATP-binding protein
VQGAERIFVEVKGPASDVGQKLKATPGVIEVRKVGENDGSHRFQVEGELRKDIRSDLARTVVQNGWDLLELQSASMSLEDIFLKLTTAEEGEKVET